VRWRSSSALLSACTTTAVAIFFVAVAS